MPTLQGKYEDAEHLYRRAMDITGTTLGEDHPQYSMNLNNLAMLLNTRVNASVIRCTFVRNLRGHIFLYGAVAFRLM